MLSTALFDLLSSPGSTNAAAFPSSVHDRCSFSTSQTGLSPKWAHLLSSLVLGKGPVTVTKCPNEACLTPVRQPQPAGPSTALQHQAWAVHTRRSPPEHRSGKNGALSSLQKGHCWQSELEQGAAWGPPTAGRCPVLSNERPVSRWIYRCAICWFSCLYLISSKSSWLQMKYDKISLIMASFNWMLFPCSSLSLKIENTEQHLHRKVHTC